MIQQKLTFYVWRYPKAENTEALGRLEFINGTPVLRGIPTSDSLRILDYIADTSTVWLPDAKAIVPIDRMNPDHLTLLCATFPCIGYQVGNGGQPVELGKDADFEQKHPRDGKGEFTAKDFSHAAHDSIGQERKYVGGPYWKHTDEVADIVASVTKDPDVIAAAHLHDVQEDVHAHPYNIDEIRRRFGDKVAGIVSELTDEYTPEKYPTINRDGRKRLEAERLGNASAEAQTIKVADLISNSDTILARDPDFAKVYLKEKAVLLDALTRANPELLARARSQIIGKDRDFEDKHPRDHGRFTEKRGLTASSAESTDVLAEFEQALKRAHKFKMGSDKLNVMAAMLHKREADRLPRVVAESELEQHIHDGEMELWRGVEEKRFATKFKGGPNRISCGVMGSGTYTAVGSDGRQYAEDFTNQGRGELMHLSLSKDAKVGDWMTVADRMAADAKRVKMTDPVNRTLYSDVGLYGAAAGYDALVSQKLGIALILNRAKLRVSKESALAKSVTPGNAGLSRRVALCMDSDRMAGLMMEPENYTKFVEAVHAAHSFCELPEWCQEEIAEAELENC